MPFKKKNANDKPPSLTNNLLFIIFFPKIQLQYMLKLAVFIGNSRLGWTARGFTFIV